MSQSLTAKGIETFLPRYKSRRKYTKRYKDFHLPLFAGYTFARFDPAVRMPVITTEGVLYAVGTGRELLPVDPAEIESLRKTVQSTLEVMPHPFLADGDRIRVAEGPLEGVEGVLISADGADHLVVSITMLQRSVGVRVQREWVRPAAS